MSYRITWSIGHPHPDRDAKEKAQAMSRPVPDPRVLQAFSDEALMDELSRREHARHLDEQAMRIWCDDCVHFEVWDKKGRAHLPIPDHFNPCTKGHKMKFQSPQEIGDDYGFYRLACRDRHIPEVPR